MVTLPNAENARAPAEKVRDYLLNAAHRTGAPKHAFFVGMGFSRERWEILSDALCEHARANPLSGSKESRYGVLYRVEGPLRTPIGRTPRVRSVWFIAPEDGAPRLITAYPREGA